MNFKVLSVNLALAGSLVFLVGCEPEVDCSSEVQYKKTLDEVIAEIQKKDPKEAEKVQNFLKAKHLLTFQSGIDDDVCGKNPETLVTLSHNYVKDKINEAKSNVENAVKTGYQKTVDAFNDALGLDEEEE